MRNPLILLSLAWLASCGPDGQTANTENAGATRVTGEILYRGHCADCHAGGVPRAPHRDMLGLMPAEYTLSAMNDGVMRVQSAHLTIDERIAIAEYLSGAPLSENTYLPPPKCDAAHTTDVNRLRPWQGWGGDPWNSRFAGSDQTAIHAGTIPDLELKWAVKMPGGTRARSQPMFAGNKMFVGGADGRLMTIDAETGCLIRQFQARAEMRHAAFVDGTGEDMRLYFGDLLGHVYALDAVTGDLIWTDRADPHPGATITASPVVHGDRVFFAVSSLEVTAAADPEYGCCTFRGSLVAYDKFSGEKIFQTYTIDSPAVPRGRNDLGTRLFGPSGAPLWASLAVDRKRNRIYAGSGENYSSPGTDRSDAVIAFDMTSGEIVWTMQALANDVWNMACMSDDPVVLQACPGENGPDYDFGAGIMYVERPGKADLVVAGQKSGDLFFLNPDTGDIITKRKIGRGGIQAGIHFGMARDGNVLYVPVSDFPDGREPIELARPGMFAVSLDNGDIQWFTRDPDDVCRGRDFCTPGISAAATAFDGAVMAGSMDGHLRAYDRETGEVIWSFDTAREFETLTGQVARGGSFGGSAGPMAHGDILYAVSGYGIYFHMPGAVLLAFEVSRD
ncbi:MAG: PQQ-binding-like beta-propeller repeat protein [Hyphomonadaceae bacterium]|nr:PQQ-binding-like beta-propeller repeat protein [Hyphomonadaceae bacterium]